MGTEAVSALYNEIEPFEAEWLTNLVKAGHIATGSVDARSIADLAPSDLAPFTQCHFFAGIGVWSYALRLAGWPDSVPVWTGSCPCQPFSNAGKRGGVSDDRHLWPTWFNLIKECAPPIIFGEQVSSPDGLAWLDLVRADLEGAGYSFAAFDLCAAGVGAPHIRQRLFFVAYADGKRCQGIHSQLRERRSRSRLPEATGRGIASIVADSYSTGHWTGADWIFCRDQKWRAVEPGSFPLVDGPSSTVGRLRAYGNAIVAPLAAEFISSVIDVLTE